MAMLPDRQNTRTLITANNGDISAGRAVAALYRHPPDSDNQCDDKPGNNYCRLARTTTEVTTPAPAPEFSLQ